MAKVELRYVQRFEDRHGRVRHYFRRPGAPRTPLPGLPGSAEFMEAYKSALAGAGKGEGAGAERTKAGSISALIVAYYRSAEFRTLKASTQSTYRNMLDRFRAEHGDKPVARLERRHIAAIIDAKAATPEGANNLLKRLRTVLAFAVDRGWRPDNPASAVRKVRVRSGGHHAWTEAEIAAYEARWGEGTRERLALYLLLFTAQRRSDVVTMGPQHVQGGRIRVVQVKTGARLALPIHPKLKAELDRWPKNQLAFLTTAYGKPFSPAGFTNWFVECAREAGLPAGCSPHGLRKAALRRLAEAGATTKQLMAIGGHKSLSEVEAYTLSAEQALLAEQAMDALEKHGR